MYPMLVRDRAKTLRRDRRGATALMVGVMGPALMGIAAFTVDAGFWLDGHARLQVAADAGALGASYLLSSASFQAMSGSTQTSTMQAVALYEARAAATKLVGTLTTPVGVSFTPYTDVTVTLTSQMGSYFLGAFGVQPPLIRAVSKVGVKVAGPCVLALGGAGASFGIKVNNSGTVSAASCPITSNYSSSPSIYLDSGNITATSVNAVGPAVISNSGSNTLDPSPVKTVGAVSDPNAGKTAPAAGTCTSHPDYTASTGSPYTANPATWCGNQTIGGNGSSITFNPGVYYISGDLTFNQVNITSANGVTFVVTGNFSWTNYSNTYQITAPTTGPTAGIAIWQVCNGSSQTATFNGGGTLVVAGTIYMPCSNVEANNNAQIKAPLSGAMNVIAKSIYAWGSAAIRTAGGGGGGGAGSVVLTQ